MEIAKSTTDENISSIENEFQSSMKDNGYETIEEVKKEINELQIKIQKAEGNENKIHKTKKNLESLIKLLSLYEQIPNPKNLIKTIMRTMKS